MVVMGILNGLFITASLSSLWIIEDRNRSARITPHSALRTAPVVLCVNYLGTIWALV